MYIQLDEEATVSKKRLKLAEGQQFIAHVPVPSQKQVSQIFVYDVLYWLTHYELCMKRTWNHL